MGKWWGILNRNHRPCQYPWDAHAGVKGSEEGSQHLPWLLTMDDESLWDFAATPRRLGNVTSPRNLAARSNTNMPRPRRRASSSNL